MSMILKINNWHLFQVSLFAELFNEMLQRDFGYRIYKAFASLPSKDERKDKKEKAKKEAERRDLKKEKDEENGEPVTKRMREEDEKRKVGSNDHDFFFLSSFLEESCQFIKILKSNKNVCSGY